MYILNEASLAFGDLIAAKTALLFAVIFMVVVWRTSQSIAIWLSLKARGYREREEVYLNGTSAVITKLGFLTTTFLILNGKGGNDEPVMRWASVSNTALDSQRLERISLKPSKLSRETEE